MQKTLDIARLSEIAHKEGVRDVYAYGSEVTGVTHPGSDIDIGVVFEKGIPEGDAYFRVYNDLARDLGELVDANDVQCPRLDLAFLEEAPINMLFRMITEGTLLYTSNPQASADFLEETIIRYNDQKYYIDEFYRGKRELAQRGV